MSKKRTETTAATSTPAGGRRQTFARSTKRGPKTKKEQILALLRRKRGASMRDLTTGTGWQAHSVRAALKGLRKRGAIIERHSEASGSRYRIAMPQSSKLS